MAGQITQTNGPSTLLGVSGASNKVPIEQIIFMLMIQQCQKKSEILKADKAELDALTDKTRKAGDLLKKINDAAAKVGASSTNAVSTQMTLSEIDEVNALIKDLGITTLFKGETTYPSPASQQQAAVKKLLTDPSLYRFTVDTGLVKTTVDKSADCILLLTQEFNAANGTSGALPSNPTQAQWDKLCARICPQKVEDDLKLTSVFPGDPLIAYAVPTDKLTQTRTIIQATYDRTLAGQTPAVPVKGGLTGTNTGRDLSSAATMMQTELQVIGQQQSSAMTKSNDDLGVQNNFLQAARNFIEEVLKLSTATTQRF